MNVNSSPTYLDYSQALCAQTDPELFFPEKGASARFAKEICSRCPVKLDCLKEAMEHNYTDGIWGGLTARERQVLRRPSNISSSPIQFNPTRRRRGRPRLLES